MIPRHLWFGTALLGLLIGASSPAIAQDNSQNNSQNNSQTGAPLLKPLPHEATAPVPAPAVTSSGIVSPPVPAWNSGSTFAQQPTHSIREGSSAPIISMPPDAPSHPVPTASFTPEPAFSSPAPVLAPLPASPAPAASTGYEPNRSYTVPPLRNVATAPEQDMAPLPGTTGAGLKPIPASPVSTPALYDNSVVIPLHHAKPLPSVPASPSDVQRPGLVIDQPAEPPAPAVTRTQAPIVSSPVVSSPVISSPAPVAAQIPAAAPPSAAVASPSTASAPPTPPDMPAVPTMADLTLSFTGASSDLTSESQTKLNNVVRQLNDMADGRLQVRGFATGEDGSASSARRIALSRVLSVRSYLMDKGVKPTRVDVRAMGTETDRSPLDRVDLLFER